MLLGNSGGNVPLVKVVKRQYCLFMLSYPKLDLAEHRAVVADLLREHAGVDAVQRWDIVFLELYTAKTPRA